MVRLRQIEKEGQATAEEPRAAITARAIARRRKRKAQATRDITTEERRTIKSIKKKANRIITGVRPRFTKEEPGQNTAAFSLRNYTNGELYEMYLQDNTEEDSLLALAMNVTNLRDTTDGKQACAFAYGILCCINPKLEMEIPVLRRMGLEINQVRLPSQAEEYAINPETETLDISSYLTIFGLTVIYVFKNATMENMSHFSTVRMNALKAAAGGDANTTVENPFNLSKAQSVRSILGSSLHLKQKILNMLLDMQNGTENIHGVCRYVATIIEYNEMSAVMFPYETLVTTCSPVLIDSRISTEFMNFSEGLELISRSRLPQYFRYLAPPQQLARIERNRFPTIAALGQKIKQEHNKQGSVKNLIGAKEGVNTLVEELYKQHKRYLSKKQPLTLEMLVKQICRPVGPTVLDDDGEYVYESDEEDDDDEEEEEEVLE